MVQEATVNRELFVKHGFPDSVFDELNRTLNQYESATEAANVAKRDRIGATADLAAVAAELIDLVKVLDGLNQFCFRDQPDLLASWGNATNIVGPGPKPAEPTPAVGAACAGGRRFSHRAPN